MYAAILAGGKGKRFWPMSRSGRPKQLLDVYGSGSMLSLTWRRLESLISPERIFVLTVEEQAKAVKAELPRLSESNLFIEPVGRNTAPSVAIASALVRRAAGGEEPILICPADHVIENEASFSTLVRAAERIAAREEVLVTFGIVPTCAATGYGYIEAGEEFCEDGGLSFFRALRFHEKPDAERAASYIEKGTFYWNSGIFMWRPEVFLSAWSKFLPQGIAPLEAIESALGTARQREVVAREYPAMPSISVDYGIFEKADNVIVVPAEIGWSDIGSWDSVLEILDRDGSGNAAIGESELLDCRGSLFFNPKGFTAAVGVDDILVIVDDGMVLVCKRGESQRVKELVESLEKKNRKELL